MGHLSPCDYLRTGYTWVQLPLLSVEEIMAKDYAKGFYKSRAWQRCRAAFISEREAIDGGLCQHCGCKRGYIVDHIVEIEPDNINNPEITLNHDNLQYLCLECHNTKTFQKHKSTRDGLCFDAEGNINKISPPR